MFELCPPIARPCPEQKREHPIHLPAITFVPQTAANIASACPCSSAPPVAIQFTHQGGTAFFTIAVSGDTTTSFSACAIHPLPIAKVNTQRALRFCRAQFDLPGTSTLRPSSPFFSFSFSHPGEGGIFFLLSLFFPLSHRRPIGKSASQPIRLLRW